MKPIRFITLNPGHFHAALVQKEMYDAVDPRVQIFAPLDADLLAHLGRLVGFNTRPQHPTRWEVDLHAGPDALKRLLADRQSAGDGCCPVVVLAGRNGAKIDAIAAAVDAGMHVLADKPWIIAAEELPRLEAVLNQADEKGLIAYDIMTERYEITSILQKELINDPAVFGTIEPGDADEPAVSMESVHYLKKNVAGAPLRRPVWFFDIHQQGEGLSDVGTHLVDLVPWMLFPEQPLDYRKDIALLSAKRWPTVLTREEFEHITGAKEFPAFLGENVKQDRLAYYCNTALKYALRGIHIEFDILWKFEAEPGTGDSHFAAFRGSSSRIEIRQGKEEKFIPELYVIPRANTVRAGLRQKLAALATCFSGLDLDDRGHEIRIVIPEQYRVGHEAHFGEVTKQFLKYLARQDALPAWEKPNMLAKYFVTTKGVELSRR